MKTEIIIKNVVCPRCIKAVQHIFESEGVFVEQISLGTVTVGEISNKQIAVIKEKLLQDGFEWLEDVSKQLISKIKAIIIQQIHYETEALTMNFSDLLAQKLNYSYEHLSRLFSSTEGRSIVSYIIAQKIEKIKDLLVHGDLPLAEIAFKMHYSSTGQFSNQFKEQVGVSPSVFRKNGVYEPIALDEV